MSLVILAMVPILIFAISANFLAQMQGLVKFNYEACTAVASDAILNYRTTKAFNLEKKMKKRSIIHILVRLLERNDFHLLIVILLFLRKLSIISENKA